MSTLQVTNIKKTGETASRDVSGVAAAWVNGSAAAVISESLNVSSGADNGTGDYTYTYTSAMLSTAYVANTDPRVGSSVIYTANPTSLTTNSISLSSYVASTNTRSDRQTLTTVMGDLA